MKRNIYLVFMILQGLLFTLEVKGQNDPDAKINYLKGIEFLKDTTYEQLDSGIHYLIQAAGIEANCQDPDGRFIADLWGYLADWYARSPYNYEYLFNSYAWYYAKAYKHNDLSQSMFQKMLLTYEKIKDENLPFNQRDPDTISYVNDEFIFPIKRILRHNGDTTWVEISAGKNEGLIPGNGFARTSYNSINPDRGNKSIGTLTVTSVSNSISQGMIVKWKNLDTAINVEINDQAIIKVRIPQKTYKGILYKLASLGVYFKDNDKNLLMHPAVLFTMETVKEEDVILDLMLKNIHETATWILEDNELRDQFKDLSSEKGAHGNKVIEAMAAANIHDLRAFFRFVLSYPAKYININYKLNETYATWLLNNSIPADTVDVYFLEQFLNIKDSTSLMEYFRLNEFYFMQYNENAEVNPSDEGYNSHQMYKASLHNNYVQDLYYRQQRKQDAFKLLDQLKKLAGYWENDTVRSLFLIQEGLLAYAEYGEEEAMKRYDMVIDLKVLAWQGHWFKANSVSENDPMAALKAYELVNEAAPWFASAWGNRGWILLKSGRPKPALEVCRMARDLAPNEMAWNVNLGHAYLLLNEQDSARLSYKRTLELIETMNSFEEGPMADFNLFIENGMSEEAMKREKAFMELEWNEHYKFKTLAKESLAEGKRLSGLGAFKEADKHFQRSAEMEQKGRVCDFERLRLTYRWRAFNLYSAKEYDSSLVNYHRALQISTNQIADETLILQDLKDVGNLYGWQDNKVAENMIRHQLRMMERKRDEQQEWGTLHVLSIGVNKHPTGAYLSAEQDASEVGMAIERINKRLFKEVKVSVLTGMQSSLLDVNRELLNVIAQSKPEDVFFFYYAGYAQKDAPWLQLGKNDSMTASWFVGKLDFMRSARKFLFIDADHGVFQDQLMEELRQRADNSLLNNDLMLLSCAYHRTENPLTGQSFLTRSFIEVLNGDEAVSINNTLITTKEVEGRMYALCGREGTFNALMSYSYGLDFNIGYESRKMAGADKTAPVIKLYSSEANMRGARSNKMVVQDQKVRVQGVVIDESPIVTFTASTGEIIVLDSLGHFSSEILCNDQQMIVLTATDIHGNKTSETLKFGQECLNSNPNRPPKNFALLIGNDEYEEWDDLQNPIRDIEVIGDILSQRYGFDVDKRYNLTKEQMHNVLDTLINKAYLPEDQLLIFVAGHGQYAENYGGSIVCRDSKKDNPTLSSYFKYSDLVTPFANHRSLRNVMIVLDVCFGGEVFDMRSARRYEGGQQYDISTQEFIKRQKQGVTRQFITSGGKEYVGDGTPGHHSPFATSFILTLEEKGKEKGYLVLSDFLDKMGHLPSTPQYGMFARAPMGVAEGEFVFEYIIPKTEKPRLSFGL